MLLKKRDVFVHVGGRSTSPSSPAGMSVGMCGNGMIDRNPSLTPGKACDSFEHVSITQAPTG
jgi:hypothetical protein